MTKKLVIVTVIIALFLAGCGVDNERLTGSAITVAVPNLVGMDKDAAVSKCSDLGLEAEIILIESTDSVNHVVKTDPVAGTKVQAASAIRLFCSKGENSNVKVPNIVGKPLDDAKQALSSAGLKTGDISYKASDKAKDIVILTDPLPGVTLSGGDKVNLVLSSGAKKESSLGLVVDLPAGDEEITLTVYIDGVLDDSYTRTANPSSTSEVKYTFKGSSGKKNIQIKADGTLYKSYILDFDKKAVIEQ